MNNFFVIGIKNLYKKLVTKNILLIKDWKSIFLLLIHDTHEVTSTMFISFVFENRYYFVTSNIHVIKILIILF